MLTEELAEMLAPLGVLAINLPTDIRRRSIYPLFTLCGAGAGVVIRSVLAYPEKGMAGMLSAALISLLPGALLLIFAWFTGEKVGYGDGIMLLMLGSWTGAAVALFSFIISLFYAAVLGTAAGKKEVPFVPYLTAGFVTVMVFCSV